MMVPLHGFLRGDTIGVIVLVDDQQTIAEVAACLQAAVAMRVAPAPHATVYAGDRLLEPTVTVAQSGLQALDRIDVVQHQTRDEADHGR